MTAGWGRAVPSGYRVPLFLLGALWLIAGLCPPAVAGGDLPPPFGLSWGMTAQAFADMLRAKGGDKAVATFEADDWRGVQMFRFTSDRSGAMPAWPPLPAYTARLDLEFDDEHGLVTVDWWTADITGDSSPQAYDESARRYGEALQALVEKYGAPLTGQSWNDGKTAAEKFRCLALAACGHEYNAWYGPTTRLRIELNRSYDEAHGGALRSVVIWAGPHIDEAILKIGRSNSPAPAAPAPPKDAKPRF